MKAKQVAIITGDVIASRNDKKQNWLRQLKKALNLIGSSPKDWEIFRGDSFQVEVKPTEVLAAALLLKTYMKQQSNIDVRIGIGIGDKTYSAAKITESNGTAFINSGECFENLKKQTMALQSPWPEFNDTINLMLSLSLLTINNWKPTTSVIIKTALENPGDNQQQLATKLKKTQSSISEGLKRGGYEELQNMLAWYKKSLPAS